MSDSKEKRARVRVYFCECGPIIKGAIDINALESRVAVLENVDIATTHATLCSESGRAWMVDDLSKHKESRVVVVGCSPREHGATFMDVCRKAAVNPYLVTMANIREQGTWVTPDKTKAEAKAFEIIRGAVARAETLEPLEEREIDANTDVVIVGAGVAGLSAAQTLAKGDRRVVLIEQSPVIGGRGALLGDIYPNMECASCLLEELMDDVLHHPNIETFTYSQVEDVLGYLGNYTVKIKQRARHVQADSCYGCKSCHEACPVETPNEFNCGLSNRKAIYIPYEGSLPNATLIDERHCLHLNAGECNACVAACPFGNINLDEVDTVHERSAGAVIIATGSQMRSLDVSSSKIVSSMALERMISSAGPTGGEIRLPQMETPSSIALIHCADERGAAPTDFCSKVCCAAFEKFSHQIHEKLPECEIHQLVWNRCMGGKNIGQFGPDSTTIPTLHRSHLRATDRVLSLAEANGRVVVRYTEAEVKRHIEADLVVISPPLAGDDGTKKLHSILRTDLDSLGYVVEENERLRPFHTRVDGVLVAGCARGPGRYSRFIAGGVAAAGSVFATLVPGRKLVIDPTGTKVDEDLCGGCGCCVVACPYKATSFDVNKKTAKVNELLCRGCGTCAVACSSGALTAKHFTDTQMKAEVSAYLESVAQDADE